MSSNKIYNLEVNQPSTGWTVIYTHYDRKVVEWYLFKAKKYSDIESYEVRIVPAADTTEVSVA
jgi:hypothetical protein